MNESFRIPNPTASHPPTPLTACSACLTLSSSSLLRSYRMPYLTHIAWCASSSVHSSSRGIGQPMAADNVCSQSKSSQTMDAVASYCDVALTCDELWRNMISTVAYNEIMLAMRTRTCPCLALHQ